MALYIWKRGNKKTENYANMRIGLVWLDTNQPSTIWDSGPNREIKIY